MLATFLRVGLLAATIAPCAAASAQTKPAAQPEKATLQELRTQRLVPHSTPPAIDWQRIKSAYAFADAHRGSIHYTLITTGTISTFASQDIQTVVVVDGKLLSDYRKHMPIRVGWIDKMLATPARQSDFVGKNYKAARDFGLVNLDLSQVVKIGWNPKVRVPGNQQGFALEIYALAWLPIEKMLANHEIDSVKDGKAIDDWLYLWNILGYAMGEDARLLPKKQQQVTDTVRMLRAMQYGQSPVFPSQLRALLRSEMEYLYSLADNGRSIDDPTKLEIRKRLAAEISFSPGLSIALGLGDDPFKGLQILDRTID